MPYVENRTIHDADAHVMELPETITEYMPAKVRAEFAPYIRTKDAAWLKDMQPATTTRHIGRAPSAR